MAEPSSLDPREQALSAHGLLGSTTRRALHRRVLSEVIEPRAVELLQRANPPAKPLQPVLGPSTSRNRDVFLS